MIDITNGAVIFDTVRFIYTHIKNKSRQKAGIYSFIPMLRNQC